MDGTMWAGGNTKAVKITAVMGNDCFSIIDSQSRMGADLNALPRPLAFVFVYNNLHYCSLVAVFAI